MTPERFSEACIPEPMSGCWLWMLACSSAGYGQAWDGVRRKVLYAHRLSWELHVGKIDAGLSILHRCDNPPCVNPRHLFLGTQQDNVDDMIAKKRNGNAIAAIHKAQTHCKRGHLLAAENLVPSGLRRGGRTCRICQHIMCKRWYTKRKRQREALEKNTEKGE